MSHVLFKLLPKMCGHEATKFGLTLIMVIKSGTMLLNRNRLGVVPIQCNEIPIVAEYKYLRVWGNKKGA